MIDFTTHEGPRGIPVHFQRLPGMPSVSVWLTMYVGSADDETFGSPGLFHWFEHTPFRGTKRFPNGYADTLFRFDIDGGYVNAFTHFTRTAYFAHVPRERWSEASDLCVDLAARPLLREVDINAERTIIKEELLQRRSSVFGWMGQHIWKALYGEHPYGHEIIGSEASLEEMSADVLISAREGAYDINRCTISVVGDLSSHEVMDALDRHVERLPDHGLSQRRAPVVRDALPPWPSGRRVTVSSPLDTSFIGLLFPMPGVCSCNEQGIKRFQLVADMIDGPRSPLVREVREKRNLVYLARSWVEIFPEGGFLCLYGLARRENSEPVIGALWDVLDDDANWTQERLDVVKRAALGELVMNIPHPHRYNQDCDDRIADFGWPIPDERYMNIIRSTTLNSIMEVREYLQPSNAFTFIAEGARKEDR